MPKYQVEDNKTGKKYIFEGDTPPTEQDIDDYLGRTTIESKSNYRWDLPEFLQSSEFTTEDLISW